MVCKIKGDQAGGLHSFKLCGKTEEHRGRTVSVTTLVSSHVFASGKGQNKGTLNQTYRVNENNINKSANVKIFELRRAYKLTVGLRKEPFRQTMCPY